MRNVLFGFLAGLAVAALGSAYLDLRKSERLTDTSDSSIATESSRDRLDGGNSASNQFVQHQSTDSAQGAAGATQRRNDLREAERLVLIDDPDNSIAEAQSERGNNEAARLRADNPIVAPLQLAPEFEWLKDSDRFTPYDDIQRETRDPAWALATETEIEEYLRARQALTSAFGVPTVECRSRSCAVAFVRYGMGANHGEVVQAFRSLIADFRLQNWESNDLLSSDIQINLEDGVATIYWSVFNPTRPYWRNLVP